MDERVPTLREALSLRSAAREPQSRDPDFTALNAIIDRIRARFHNPTTFRDLSHGEQVVYELGYTMDAEVQNGGWHQYLGNSSGNGAEEHKAYLREVGAAEVLALLERVSTIFPNAVVPHDWSQRNQLLRRAVEQDPSIVDGLLEQADRAYYRECASLYTHLMDYVETHVTDFENPPDAPPRRRSRSRPRPRR